MAAVPDRDEPRALTALAFDELRRAPGGIWGMHRAIADRAFRASGAGAAPARVTHDAIAKGAYGVVGRGFAAAGRLADAALRSRPDRRRVISHTPRGSAVVAAVTGLIGDRLEQERNDLHQPLAVRVAGQPVALERAALASAYPQATPRIVVFLHGLMETEFSWRIGAGAGGETYGTRLARDLGCTAVYVRFNSGRHISENGRDLSHVLTSLVENWPGGAEEIALVGHSMGGLVARSACHLAAEAGAAWVHRVRHVVSLGSPHMGAPLEQAVHVASAALHAVPEMRPFSAFLRRRSAGIRDLRQGSLVDEDWADRDPDALRAVACREVPLLDGATHCFVAATITRSPRHPLGRLIGDWLVLQPSASGRSRARRIPFKAEHGMHVGPATHFALLNHPQVYERLRDWLAAPSPAVAGVA
jgi:pimeloyl-ACP methyl ester carboxylesterase